MRHLAVGFAIGILFLTTGCGTIEDTVHVPPKTNEQMIQDSYIEALELSATEGTITIEADTFFKTSTAQSSNLSATEKCKIAKDTKLEFESLGNEKEDHINVVLKVAPAGCTFKVGYFYKAHTQLKVTPVYSLTVKQATRFKSKNKPSNTLTSKEYCEVPTGKFYLEADAVMEADHFRVTLKPNQISCAFLTGYFYSGHLSEVQGSDGDFAKVIRHILIWEGGCSDDPDDRGGRTYKGITTSRARANGFTGDVCTMPDWMVLSIYKKDYWLKHPYKFVWPMNLAVMNTEVNSGSGRSQQFLDRMDAQNIQGTWPQKADWFVQQQINFYYAIVAANSSQRKFLAGWLNRSNYMKDVIWGRRSATALVSVDGSATAKALAEDDAP